ncbi:MAG: hypothetical protein FGM43_11200 [Sinobacteraceae bacterium]|nr:hypothetical protein [Nevskiaceae bacterium]
MSREPMRRTIRGGRPYFFADPAIDKILNMVVVLGSEVWTLRERLAAFEAIQVRQGGLAAGEIDAFDFSPEQEAKLAAERKEFIDSLFRILQEQVEEARGRTARAPQKPAEPVAARKRAVPVRGKSSKTAKRRSRR